MSNGIYFYKLQSNYAEDVTKNCKLTINEIDSNFKSLKDEDIKKAEFIRETKSLVLTRNNGETLIVDLSDLTYDLNVDTSCSEDGVASITISYDGKDGKETITFGNLVTIDKVKELINGNMLTRVLHDGTLKGDGTISSPLGINGTEKTGMLAPAKAKVDLTNGEKLPTVSKLGTRYVTVEYVNDYGYLYNYDAVQKIAEKLLEEGNGWRIPTKEDWDALLDSIEECRDRNHSSAKCHVELGKQAGRYLKSECGWIGQHECECSSTAPMGCTTTTLNTDDYLDDSSSDVAVPSDKTNLTDGVDKYGMAVLPCGFAALDSYNKPYAQLYKEKAFFWTSSHVYGDVEQDLYVKELDWNKGGIVQEAVCPDVYYSLRLVKDYDGRNDYQAEYIDGVNYTTRAFPESKQVWTTVNYAKKEGFKTYDGDGTIPEVTDVNAGEVRQRRKALFINEFNGEYWEKRQLNEGDSIVIESSCSTSAEKQVQHICWEEEIDGEKAEKCVDVEVPSIQQNNIEYRVYTTDDCSQDLISTDDSVLERVLITVIPIIEREIANREKADDELGKRIDAEISARTDADNALSDRIDKEISDRTDADDAINARIDKEISDREDDYLELDEKINKEISDRTDGDKALSDRIDKEVSDRTDADEALNEKIDTEISERKAEDGKLDASINAEKNRAEGAESALRDAINAEKERATAKENEIDAKIDKEISDRKEADSELNDKIDKEIADRKEEENATQGKLIDAAESPYTLKAYEGVILKSIDKKDENSIKINFDGNFGEI